MTAPYVLLAEDDQAFRVLVARALRARGYKVVECSHGMELVEKLSGAPNDELDPMCLCVVSDIRMPGVMGTSVLEGLAGLGSRIPVFLMTAFGDTETHARAHELGAVRVFDKPFRVDELVAAVESTVGPDARLP